jgi:hypothetical protein
MKKRECEIEKSVEERERERRRVIWRRRVEVIFSL